MIVRVRRANEQKFTPLQARSEYEILPGPFVNQSRMEHSIRSPRQTLTYTLHTISCTPFSFLSWFAFATKLAFNPHIVHTLHKYYANT